MSRVKDHLNFKSPIQMNLISPQCPSNSWKRIFEASTRPWMYFKEICLHIIAINLNRSFGNTSIGIWGTYMYVYIYEMVASVPPINSENTDIISHEYMCVWLMSGRLPICIVSDKYITAKSDTSKKNTAHH